jgi:hypothetical protein
MLPVNATISIDMLFSYWMIAWFLIYYFLEPFYPRLRKYGNPMLGFYIAWAEHIYLLIEWFLSQSFSPMKQMISVFSHISILATIKLLPMYLLYKYPIYFWENAVILLGVFILYNIYLYMVYETNSIEVYQETNKSLLRDENRTPFMSVLHTILRQFSNIQSIPEKSFS